MINSWQDVQKQDRRNNNENKTIENDFVSKLKLIFNVPKIAINNFSNLLRRPSDKGAGGTKLEIKELVTVTNLNRYYGRSCPV